MKQRGKNAPSLLHSILPNPFHSQDITTINRLFSAHVQTHTFPCGMNRTVFHITLAFLLNALNVSPCLCKAASISLTAAECYTEPWP